MQVAPVAIYRSQLTNVLRKREGQSKHAVRLPWPKSLMGLTGARSTEAGFCYSFNCVINC